MEFRRYGLVLLLLLMACAGGSSGPGEPVNRAPTITFTFNKLGVVRSSSASLSVDVSDADGDPLSVSWSVTRGTLTAQSGDKTVMLWDVPATVGVDTVRVSVNDGTVTRRLVEEIKVGWPASSSVATFLKSRSPYIVSVSSGSPILVIQAGETSVVEAGTEILIDTPGTLIDVTGSLITQGIEDEPVVIQPNLRDASCGQERGWWEGIRGSSDAPANGFIDLVYTEVKYGKNGIRLRDQASAVLNHCLVQCSGDNGILHEGFGSLVMSNTQVTDGRAQGVAIESITAQADSVYIDHCELKFNGGSGLRVSINDPSQQVPITVEYTKFQYNFTQAVTLARASFPRIHFCVFTGNGLGVGVANIFLENGYPEGVSVTELDLTCNYWGSLVSNQATIDATIRDSLDAPGTVGTRVISDPWLNSDPLVTPPSCTPPTS